MKRDTLSVRHEYIHETWDNDEIRIVETNKGSFIRINGGRLYKVSWISMLMGGLVDPEELEDFLSERGKVPG